MFTAASFSSSMYIINNLRTSGVKHFSNGCFQPKSGVG
jgi:hypothetical protein